MIKFMWVNFNCPIVQTFSCLIAGYTPTCSHDEILRSTSCTNLYFKPAHKVVMKDDNWCQNLFNLLMFIFLI